MTNYAERRVLSLLIAQPELYPSGLSAGDFRYSFHQEIFKAIEKGTDVTDLELADDVKAYMLDLDEDYAPENLALFSNIVKTKAALRQFAQSVGRLRK